VATDALVRHDAVINKLIGDEVMAFRIGSPESGLRAGGAGVRCEAEVGERVLPVDVLNEPCDLLPRADLAAALCVLRASAELRSRRLVRTVGVA
jgi:hypothetical protein